MTRTEMVQRTKAHAVRVIRAAAALPNGRIGDVIGRQLVRAGTSIGANYRTAGRARSKREFIAKLGIVEEEADETIYWLELAVLSGLIRHDRVANLLRETEEILKIVVASIKSARVR